MNVLSLEQLLQLHALVIDRTGGSSGLRDLRRLEAALASQTQNVLGEELYPTVTDKAAAIIRGIIADRAFVNSNKRTALLAGLTLLKVNRLAYSFTNGEIEDFAVKIANKKLDIPQITTWLGSHLK